MNRRSFIGKLTSKGGMLVAISPYLFASESIASPSKLPTTTKTDIFISHSKTTINPGLSRRQWKTIMAVQEHLFPAGNKTAPSAGDVNSKAYLYAVLADPDRDNEDRILVKEGLVELQDICWKEYQKLFIDCNHQQKEVSLRLLEKTHLGRPWIMTILGYIFEALFVDPIYGGNPNNIGWKWLDHNPGLPRPTEHQKYFLL